ncbi:MAG TPA: class I SAM-dependent methyltransferase [Flavobacterium sp.]|jgi:SAM-dependent methyltransferase|nr:class I SAM-dependent methyltransferase [Flavobacterium sp.]HRZ32854.1 class I SAM-dependent methyltransferase [Flavobacterium sp.]HRZ75396.1 class I SAM-dependent methyltransferase [Flavobacterium sp.]
MKCPLCNHPSNHFYSQKSREFYFCTKCFSVFLDDKNYISETEERKHYEMHNNDVNDIRYQSFVSPIVDSILNDFKKTDKGLDFGSGTGPVITKMLRDNDYDIQEYDPFFADNSETLKQKYDYIACCEVIEHFHHPKKEFELLFNLLKPGGKLYCKTDLFTEVKNFDSWGYKNDPTHVFFYHQKSILWIQKNIGFTSVKIDGRLIVFEK